MKRNMTDGFFIFLFEYQFFIRFVNNKRTGLFQQVVANDELVSRIAYDFYRMVSDHDPAQPYLSEQNDRVFRNPVINKDLFEYPLEIIPVDRSFLQEVQHDLFIDQ